MAAEDRLTGGQNALAAALGLFDFFRKNKQADRFGNYLSASGGVDPFGQANRERYQGLLAQATSPGFDPSQLPGFQSAMDYAVRGMDRKFASRGQFYSGARLAALNDLMMTKAYDAWNRETDRYKDLSGANFRPDAATAGNLITGGNNTQDAGFNGLAGGITSLYQLLFGEDDGEGLFGKLGKGTGIADFLTSILGGGSSNFTSAAPGAFGSVKGQSFTKLLGQGNQAAGPSVADSAPSVLNQVAKGIQPFTGPGGIPTASLAAPTAFGGITTGIAGTNEAASTLANLTDSADLANTGGTMDLPVPTDLGGITAVDTATGAGSATGPATRGGGQAIVDSIAANSASNPLAAATALGPEALANATPLQGLTGPEMFSNFGAGAAGGLTTGAATGGLWGGAAGGANATNLVGLGATSGSAPLTLSGIAGPLALGAATLKLPETWDTLSSMLFGTSSEYPQPQGGFAGVPDLTTEDPKTTSTANKIASEMTTFGSPTAIDREAGVSGQGPRGFLVTEGPSKGRYYEPNQAVYFDDPTPLLEQLSAYNQGGGARGTKNADERPSSSMSEMYWSLLKGATHPNDVDRGGN